MQTMFPCQPRLHHPVKLGVGAKATLEEQEEEVAEEAILIGLVTQMSHRFPHSQLAMTHLIVRVHLIVATTPEGMV